MKDMYRIKAQPQTNASNIFTKGKLRVSVLTPSLVRIEWSEKKCFTQKPTQKVWNRNFPKADFCVSEENGETRLCTKELEIFIKDDNSFSDSVRIVMVHPVNVLKNSWSCGENFTTLGGTARTLDRANGAIPLEKGIVSGEGFTVLDDSASYLIEDDGTLYLREDSSSKDIYFFGYGHRYREALKDYFALTGFPPLLPRYALGNWWSRYWQYTQEEYLSLMERFKSEGIPLSVAMIDMDWHLVDIDRSIGTGWTGYTWNKKLFPEPKEFLSELHKKNLKVSLNVHPAEGIGRHEEAYEKMKQALGEEADGSTVGFDIADTKFREAYFEVLHHPLEKDGVDFWWIDWQQGNSSGKKGLDPLWLLNHYHYMDNARGKKRPLILSRYAGPGSHRYPIGFSGDTVISWESLAFQPYFTVTASNIGYGWWSHDIGGHMLGTYDEELQVRWAQWGVFSPIMRLHSSASPFNHKEPWNYGTVAGEAIKKIMLLRHRMIPYLYTMNRLYAEEGRALLEPLYYQWPEEDEAYEARNEYFFGTELIACPITEKSMPELNRARVSLWLPQGEYTDFFTGMTYCGNRKLTMYRTLENFPLLIKSGGIIPLMSKDEAVQEGSAEKLPLHFDIYVALGSDGEFALYEDAGDGMGYKAGESATTKFTWAQNERTFKIHAAKGDANLLPQKRKYTVHFMNCPQYEKILGAEKTCYDKKRRELVCETELCVTEEAKIQLGEEKEKSQQEKITFSQERVFSLLDKMNIDFVKKEALFATVKKSAGKQCLCTELLESGASIDIAKAIMEQVEND